MFYRRLKYNSALFWWAAVGDVITSARSLSVESSGEVSASRISASLSSSTALFVCLPDKYLACEETNSPEGFCVFVCSSEWLFCCLEWECCSCWMFPDLWRNGCEPIWIFAAAIFYNVNPLLRYIFRRLNLL